jgi:transcriptional regulator with XRE-family HTH domain
VRTIQDPRHLALVALLIAERKRVGMRQVDVARRVGQSQGWIAHIESGQRRIDVVEFLALADGIGFDPLRVLRRIRQAD